MALLVALLAASSGCKGSRVEQAPTDVLLLVVDTLRADHLSLYGYSRDTSPALNRLAADAVVFERAHSQAPCTFPSMNSLLTSRFPLEFIGQGKGNLAIPDGIPTLASVLREHGLATFAASASEVVRATPSRHNRVGGYQRGFDVFDEGCVGQPASCLNARGRGFLDEGPAPFFIYLHFMEPHSPYQPPPEHRRRFAGPYAGNALIAAGMPTPIEDLVYKQGRPDLVSAADVVHLRDLYDEEISYFDEQLDDLFRLLRERKLLDSTIVILAADHGESFDEHGSYTHCRTIYDSETHTPLLMWIPGVSGRRVAAPAENLDILPTVVDYLGFAPPAGVRGRSVRPVVEGRPEEPPRVARSFHKQMRSINDERYRVMLDVTSGWTAAFDRASDPAETIDLLATSRPPQPVVALRARLLASVAEIEGNRVLQNVRAGERVEESLRSLGYLQ
ncbi:sulfatase [Candidatus Binatia bacterium]|nr:sulfatase [Candidatus Binatia bacterium]